MLRKSDGLIVLIERKINIYFKLLRSDVNPRFGLNEAVTPFLVYLQLKFNRPIVLPSLLVHIDVQNELK